MKSASLLDEIPGITHRFFTREQGASDGIYRGLNCGPGSRDDPQRVKANRTKVATDMGVEEDHLLTVHQIHSATAVTVTEPWTDGQAPQADALVTGNTGLALGILTADCAPVLFAASDGGTIGAAHAGWKGALNGVLETTLDAMAALGAARETIVAVIGPTISQEAYEVGPEFKENFVAQDPQNNRWFAPSPEPDAKPGHTYFDLPGYVAARLRTTGISQVHNTCQCTYQDEARFFSYRRATHRGEPDYGRLISVIARLPG